MNFFPAGFPFTGNSSSGNFNFIDKNFANLNLVGCGSLTRVNIANQTIITGDVRATTITTKSLIVVGNATLISSTIHEKTTINGNLSGNKTHFLGPADITAEDVSFTDCDLSETITIKRSTSNRQQIVKLEGNTILRKGIIFEGNDGLIIQSPNSKILGNIFGATIR